FQQANKGFEGLAHAWRGGREYLYALCENNLGSSARGGRIDVFVRARDGGWKASHRILLPMQVELKDYAALAYRDRQLAVVSQASARPVGRPGRRESTRLGPRITSCLSLSEQELRQCRGNCLVVPRHLG